MRYICLLAVLLALPLTASAQQQRSGGRQPDQNRSAPSRSNDRRADDRRSDDHRTDDRHQANKPATVPATPWWEQRQPPAWERPQTPAWERRQTPAWERQQVPAWQTINPSRTILDRERNQRQQIGGYRGQRQYRPSVVYVLPSYGYFSNPIPTSQFVVTPPMGVPGYVEAQPPAPPMGALRLEVEPKESLQIFVDGAFVGTLADLGDELELTPGTRRIELRALGYRTLVFSAEIVDGQSITYRGALAREELARPPAVVVPVPPVAPAPPTGSRTMYVIPGCYLGNVSPKSMALPAGCDISKLTTILP